MPCTLFAGSLAWSVVADAPRPHMGQAAPSLPWVPEESIDGSMGEGAEYLHYLYTLKIYAFISALPQILWLLKYTEENVQTAVFFSCPIFSYVQFYSR